MATVNSRSSLVVALLRSSSPIHPQASLQFLLGLSKDELLCLAEFHGAWNLEMLDRPTNPYALLEEFFDLDIARWGSMAERSHKMFVAFTWLDQLESARVATSTPALPR